MTYPITYKNQNLIPAKKDISYLKVLGLEVNSGGQFEGLFL